MGSSVAFSTLAGMRIALGSDHAGFALKRALVPFLAEQGHAVTDVGPAEDSSVDYPTYAARAAALVSEGRADRAVLACGSGVGMSIVANKLPGVRAVNALDPETAALARAHNDVNALCLAGRRLDEAAARKIAIAFLDAAFEGGRHARRLAAIAAVERGSMAA